MREPEAVWEKHADLFTRVDVERARFLAFERWWNGFYFLSREEILAIKTASTDLSSSSFR